MGCSSVKMISSNPFFSCNFKHQANSLKELKKILKKNYDYYLNIIETGTFCMNKFPEECEKAIEDLEKTIRKNDYKKYIS